MSLKSSHLSHLTGRIDADDAVHNSAVFVAQVAAAASVRGWWRVVPVFWRHSPAMASILQTVISKGIYSLKVGSLELEAKVSEDYANFYNPRLGPSPG